MSERAALNRNDIDQEAHSEKPGVQQPVTTIVFDIGRVLIRFEWWEYINKLMDEETAKAVTDAMWGTGYWHELDRGVLSTSEIFELFCGAAPEYRDSIRLAFENVGICTERQDYAIPWIREMQELGYRVLYLSNYSEHVMSLSSHALDFLPYMDGGIISCHVRLIKPDPAIYECLCSKYDLKPEECLFIDDNAANIEAARAFGMHALQFESFDQAHDAVLRYLQDLPGKTR
ncbi:MAG: HAD family phosphatase [Mogibacterium sp.]|nr:HAD family phosphatase [Mogibacterium sp.]